LYLPTFDGEFGGCFLVVDAAAVFLRVLRVRRFNDQSMNRTLGLCAESSPVPHPGLYLAPGLKPRGRLLWLGDLGPNIQTVSADLQNNTM